MPAVHQVDRWCNIPKITGPMDLAIPKLAELKTNNPSKYKSELNKFCMFLVEHPLAIEHKKSFNSLHQHMSNNINLYLKGCPFYH